MNYTRMLGLLAVATTALMAFAASASATITSPAGTPYGGEFVATSINFQFDFNVSVACQHSEVRWKSVNAAGELDPGNTTGRVEAMTFSQCGRKVSTLNKGHIYIESDGDVISTGARVTLSTLLWHCLWETNETKIGTLTEGIKPAVWHIGQAPVKQVLFTGCNDAIWTGTYTVNTPNGEIVVD